MQRLMCFFDGTWNVPNGRADVTNVVKLARVALGTAPDGVAQVTRYIQGIGTDPDDSEHRAFIEGAIGVGVDQRIMEGYRFLAERYRPGDELYLFGFSRGAFQARSLAGLISRIELLNHEALDHAQEAWSYYQSHRSKPDPERLGRLKALGHADVRIRCLGVWDTVGNLGIPFATAHALNGSVAFHDTELSPIVDVGLHALAIDEPRGPFSPSLWTRPRGAAAPAGQQIEQVWFAGSHANVGGGYPDSGLSDVALLWMAERTMQLTSVAFDLERLRAAAKPDPLAELVSPTSDGIYRVSYFLPFLRLIEQNAGGIPAWRRSVLGTWRTSRIDDGLETVNESLHPAAIARFGRMARYRRGTTVRQIAYRPRRLELAIEGGRIGRLDSKPARAT